MTITNEGNSMTDNNIQDDMATEIDPTVDATLEDTTGDTLEPTEPETDKAGNEAAKYRRQLRAAEGERDALTTRLATYQAREAEGLINAATGDTRDTTKHLLHDPADLWRDGATVADVLDDEGQVDPVKVAELAATLCEAHPHWRAVRLPVAAPASLVTGQGPIATTEATQDWTGVLSQAGRQTH